MSSHATPMSGIKHLIGDTPLPDIHFTFRGRARRIFSTDLLRDEPVAGDDLSPAVEFTGYGALKCVCHTCCDMEDCAERLFGCSPL